jgi:ribosomal-protein-alanine N-acetyltransferase
MATRLLRLNADLPSLMEIETQSFTDPWTEDEFRQAIATTNAFAIVYATKTVITGFAICVVLHDTVSLINMAVHPEHRRKGHGRRLLARILGRSARRMAPLTLVVSEHNDAMHAFLKSCGVKANLVIPSFYDGDIDGYLFFDDRFLDEKQPINSDVG